MNFKIFNRKSEAERSPVAWPLFLLSLPAFVSIWSGWVGMGRKSGFGPVNPLPGIMDSFQIDTAITLPIGLEAYAAYSMYAWLAAAHLSTSTRRFAMWSAFGSLVLGTAGQAAYHVMESTGVKTAPVEIVIAVSAIPVIVLGLGTGLAHAMRKDWHAYRATVQNGTADVVDVEVIEDESVPASADAKESHEPVPASRPAPRPAPRPAAEREINPSAKDLSTDEKYRVGLRAYHESVIRPGRPLSQRDLAAVMGMKNRELAIKIIREYKEADAAGSVKDLLSSAGIESEVREDDEARHDAVSPAA
jgi:hypothetical protein